MLDKEKYREYVKYIRERWNSIHTTAMILCVSPNTVNSVLKWKAILELSKIKIMNGYDEWMASRVKK